MRSPRAKPEAPICRLAVASDHAAIAALRNELGRPGDASGWVDERLRADSEFAGKRALFVAHLADRVVGYAVAERFAWKQDPPQNAAPAGFYLAGVFVQPSQRLRGAGSALVQARLRWIAGRSRVAYYYANDDNLASVALHEKVGFRPLMTDFAHPWVRDPASIMTLYVLDNLVAGEHPVGPTVNPPDAE